MTLTTYLQLISTTLNHKSKTTVGMEIRDKYFSLYRKNPPKKREAGMQVNDYSLDFMQDQAYPIIMKSATGRAVL